MSRAQNGGVKTESVVGETCNRHILGSASDRNEIPTVVSSFLGVELLNGVYIFDVPRRLEPEVEIWRLPNRKNAYLWVVQDRQNDDFDVYFGFRILYGLSNDKRD